MMDDETDDYHSLQLQARLLPEASEVIPSSIRTMNLVCQQNLNEMVRGPFMNSFLRRTSDLLEVSSRSDVENILRGVVSFLRTLDISPEINNETIYLYEFTSNALKRCCAQNVQDSRLVVTLLKYTIDLHSVERSDNTTSVPQPMYPQDFYKYLLSICQRGRFDLPAYCSSHPDTLWTYSRTFSVADAVAFGDYERCLFLLQHGVELFPGHENTDSFFPNVPQDLRIILYIMASIKSRNQLLTMLMSSDNNPCSLDEDQKRCFHLVWRTIRLPYVRSCDFDKLRSMEFYNLMSGYINMYASNFADMVSIPKQPRSLKHLTKCVIRERLRDNWNLPDGMKHLNPPVMPKHLQTYLNLESNENWED